MVVRMDRRPVTRGARARRAIRRRDVGHVACVRLPQTAHPGRARGAGTNIRHAAPRSDAGTNVRHAARGIGYLRDTVVMIHRGLVERPWHVDYGRPCRARAGEPRLGWTPPGHAG